MFQWVDVPLDLVTFALIFFTASSIKPRWDMAEKQVRQVSQRDVRILTFFLTLVWVGGIFCIQIGVH